MIRLNEKQEKGRVKNMVSETFKVSFEEGLHMRPAGRLAAEMSRFESRITIVYGDTRTDAKSILSIMAAGIKYGSEIIIECDGADEQAALAAAAELLRG